ncbi:aminotransferase class IV [Flavobacterium sp.]|uniref:aminotransferase class IV n=1 Tax=Flavobacterium sp. TaxID=239 RepID=UPI00262E8DEF|nr:aminotransferase class IV [Flavobacterium sp.]MDD3004059.1 aminotransferase class IV [Flavobacterium sp.]
MVNFNGTIVKKEDNILAHNRGFLFGDAVFETLKVVQNKILFLEDHYFRLMSSMRILRMEIPMHFTMEFLEQEILNVARENGLEQSARIRMTVYRNSEGFYLPQSNAVGYLIQSSALPTQEYKINTENYEVDLFKDFYITKQLLSTIKSTNKAVHITGSIFANENGLQNCLLLNDSKNIIEALNGNIFMLKDGKLSTPPISEGCLNGIMRKQILAIAKNKNIEVVEEVISPFDLQKADELFITNVIMGIQSITKYRKKEYANTFASELTNDLNHKFLLV